MDQCQIVPSGCRSAFLHITNFSYEVGEVEVVSSAHDFSGLALPIGGVENSFSECFNAGKSRLGFVGAQRVDGANQSYDVADLCLFGVYGPDYVNTCIAIVDQQVVLVDDI